MTIYESAGTVRFVTDRDSTQVAFTPDKDYEVKHEGESYAIFLDKNNKEVICRQVIDNSDGIEISMQQETTELFYQAVKANALSACMKQTKVRVRVEEVAAPAPTPAAAPAPTPDSGQNKCLNLVGITFPAK